jgi:predicted RNA polymerase sigma factor
MSPAGWEHQALQSIQSALGHTDPKLASQPSGQGAAARAYEAALALTQNAAERAYLVTMLAAQRAGHPDGVADGQGQVGGDG